MYINHDSITHFPKKQLATNYSERYVDNIHIDISCTFPQ